MSENIIPLLCLGFAVTLAGIFVLDRRLAALSALPRNVLALVDRERERAQAKAIDVLTERVALKAGQALSGIDAYRVRLEAVLRDALVQAESRERMLERRSAEAGATLQHVNAELLRQLELLRDATRELRAARATRPDRQDPILPPYPEPTIVDAESTDGERRTAPMAAPPGFDEDEERTGIVDGDELVALRKQLRPPALTAGRAS